MRGGDALGSRHLASGVHKRSMLLGCLLEFVVTASKSDFVLYYVLMALN